MNKIALIAVAALALSTSAFADSNLQIFRAADAASMKTLLTDIQVFRAADAASLKTLDAELTDIQIFRAADAASLRSLQTEVQTASIR